MVSDGGAGASAGADIVCKTGTGLGS